MLKYSSSLKASNHHFILQQPQQAAAIDWSDGKDLYNLSPVDKALFMADKEAQYKQRREVIAGMCHRLQEFPTNKEELRRLSNFSYDMMFYDSKDKIAWCHIAKVK